MIPDLLIEYQEYSPPPVAADHIHSIWAFRVAADADTVAHTVWPDACASIVFPSVGPYALFMGAETGPRATPVHRASVTWGIRAWVDAAAVFGHTCVGMRGIVSLAPHFDRLGMRLRASPQHGELLLREWCETQAESWHTPDPIVRATANYIIAHSHRVRLTDIAAHVSLGPRQLQRRFVAATGVTIKEFARVRRLRETLSTLLTSGQRTLSAIAMDAGFADHAHLSREVARLAGLTPRQVADRISRIRHVDVRP